MQTLLSASLIDDSNQVFPLDDGIIIGQSSSADIAIRLSGSGERSDFAVIRFEGLRLLVCNLNKKNPCQLNGNTHNGFAPLEHGDKLLVGECVFTVDLLYYNNSGKSWRSLPWQWTQKYVGEGGTVKLTSGPFDELNVPRPFDRLDKRAHIIYMEVVNESIECTWNWQPLDLSVIEDRRAWYIGRGQKCEIQIKGDETMSAEHALLSYSGQQWRLSKLPSINRMYVNGRPFITAFLKDGDVITVGRTCLTFYANEL